MPKHALLNQPAPPVTLPSIPNGTPYTLPIGSKPIALFFFPGAFTVGCTREACAFRDAKADNLTFKRHPELEVVGVSHDPVERQQSFADQYGLPFPLLSDEGSKTFELYHIPKWIFGTTNGRQTFFIDKSGIITGVCDSNINFAAHTRFVEKQLREMENANGAGKGGTSGTSGSS